MAIFDELKSVAKTLREADKIPQYEQILAVQEKLLEMQKRIMDIEEENRALKNQLNIKSKLVYERGSYWIKEDNISEGPFCSRCWDVTNKLVRTRQLPSGNFLCKECKSYAQ